MSLSTQRHGNLYKFEQMLHMHQKVRGMETRSMNKGSIWQSISPQYHHNHEEWNEDLDNDEIK